MNITLVQTLMSLLKLVCLHTGNLLKYLNILYFNVIVCSVIGTVYLLIYIYEKRNEK